MGLVLRIYDFWGVSERDVLSCGYVRGYASTWRVRGQRGLVRKYTYDL